MHNLDVRTAHPLSQGGGQNIIHFDRGEVLHLGGQHLGRTTGSRTDLQYVITQVQAIDNTRDDPFLDRLGPFGTGT